jgi:hypothetical protein
LSLLFFFLIIGSPSAGWHWQWHPDRKASGWQIEYIIYTMQQNRVLNFTKQEKRIYEQILTSAKHDNFQKQEEIYLLFARKKEKSI